MKRAIFVAALLLAAPFAHAEETPIVEGLPACGEEGYEPPYESIDAHRGAPIPAIAYEPGTRSPYARGMTLIVGVDATGRVTCMHAFADTSDEITPKRVAALKALAATRYMPFERDGVAVPARIEEYIGEEDIPVHRPMPEVPLDQVRFKLETSSCMGSCPIYTVDVRGTGDVTFVGQGYTDVEGTHRYRVAPEAVARLLAQAKAADFWSMREHYDANSPDMPSTTVTLALGADKHSVVDSFGSRDGMPEAMNALQRAIDEVARSQQWIRLSNASLDALKGERFDFRSKEGASLLMRALIEPGDDVDEGAILRLIELGAPIGAYHGDLAGWSEIYLTPLENALSNRMARVTDALIARGALGTPARPNRKRIDAAFVAAVEGGDFALMQRIWNFSAAARPALIFEGAPVTLLLKDRYGREWQGFRAAQWLVGLGCDPKATDAEGNTLLQTAVTANDAALVRWLLGLGVDVQTRTRYGTPLLDFAEEEAVALALLEGGARMTPMMLDRAKRRQWKSVLAR